MASKASPLASTTILMPVARPMIVPRTLSGVFSSTPRSKVLDGQFWLHEGFAFG